MEDFKLTKSGKSIFKFLGLIEMIQNPELSFNDDEPELFGWCVDTKTLYKISGEDWTHQEQQLLVNAYNFEFGKIQEAVIWAEALAISWMNARNEHGKNISFFQFHPSLYK